MLQHVPWVGRLLAPAILHGFAATIEMGLKEQKRLMLARTVMERHLVGLRTSSRLPGLIDLVMARPLVSADMVSSALDVTPRTALRIVADLGLRAMTGRGRFDIYKVGSFVQRQVRLRAWI